MFTILVTLHTGTYSTAPAEAFATTEVIWTDLLFGMITPWAPTASAVLIIVPRLWGSVISSKIIKNGSSPFLLAIYNNSSNS